MGLVMSDQQRSTIEGALSALRSDDTAALAQQSGSTDPTAGLDVVPAGAEDPAAVEGLTRRLRGLGFDGVDVQRALMECGAQPPSASAALDWLCLHVPHERLPKGFAAGAITNNPQLCKANSTCSLAPCTLDMGH